METKSRHIQTCVFLLLLISFVCFAEEASTAPKQVDMTELSMEDLMNIEVKPTASLTRTTERNRPAAVTVITREDIANSQARSLDELLDLYVPNFQMALHTFETQHIGVRGNLFDRDDKYLLLVNGRIMNERTHYGAISERDLPMLRDIQRVEVVRGPGSVLYGPGALTMVINIITENAQTFQGTEITSRLGSIDEFYSSEVKWGKVFKDKSGLYIYAGVAEQRGAQGEDSKYVGSKIYRANPGRWPAVYAESYEPRNFPKLPNYRGAWRELEKLKAHVAYTKDDFEFWTRYTRGGSTFTPWLDNFMAWANPDTEAGAGYQQYTVYAGNRWRVSDEFNIDYSFSFDLMDMEKISGSGTSLSSWREDEYHSKIVASWNPNEQHSFAFGGEWSYELFGKDSPGFPNEHSTVANSASVWGTNTISTFGEYQWKFDPKWVLFLGSRIDWHTFTNHMFSPRVALVNQTTDKDTLKAIYQSAVRTTLAEEMKKNYDADKGKSDYETYDSYELRWERQHTKNVWLALSGFYSNHEVVAWGSGGTHPLGVMKLVGAEFEAIYKKDKTKIMLSHGYTKLMDFKLENPNDLQIITAEPYGYGDDLAIWHNHVSKLSAHYQVDKKLSLDGLLNVYWGLPSGEEVQEMNYDYAVRQNWSRKYPNSSFQSAFKPSIHLNLGLSYDMTENLNIRFMAHDVLGWFDENWNKRNSLPQFNTNHDCYPWRVEPASFSVTMTYRF